MRRTTEHRWPAIGALLLAPLLASCASSGPSEPAPRTVVQTGPPPATAADAARPLPALPVSQADHEGGTAWPRIESLEAVNEDLAAVLRGVADEYGLAFQIDPGVNARVTTRLRNSTLREALDALILPHGYTYDLTGQTLRVERAGVQSRLFTLDFISLSRVGVGTTVIQRRLSNVGGRTGAGSTTAGGQSGGLAGGAAGGADIITSVEVTDLWEDIRVALEGLVFGEVQSAAEAGLQQQRPTAMTGGLGGNAPQTTARVSEDGRRLIVNPAAGTILVAAPPHVLDEVGLYIRSFEAAIQRQVRIEAKFVEVVLDREFEFGIDWGAVQRFGDVSIRLESTPSSNAVEFNLVNGLESVTAVLTALSSQGDVRVLSSPGVSTLNNQRAVFNVTTEEVFFAVTRQPVRGVGGEVIQFETSVETQPVAVGIVMDVLPQISADNQITMNVRPMVTSLARIEEFSQDDNFARAPVIDRRELDTMVRVRSGETHVIGGLIQTRTENIRSGVPLLKDIPYLGWLFGRTRTVERRSELVIFITPTIIAGTVPVAP
jgi:MSHA type pilus biogenesis protein MshL